MAAVTYEKGKLGRIYARLRKRSYRRPGGHGGKHNAYVEGVKDALYEVARQWPELEVEEE